MASKKHVWESVGQDLDLCKACGVYRTTMAAGHRYAFKYPNGVVTFADREHAPPGCGEEPKPIELYGCQKCKMEIPVGWWRGQCNGGGVHSPPPGAALPKPKLPEIKPEDISVAKHFWDAFGQVETEVSAQWIVRYCQSRGGWVPFTYAALNAFYQRERHSKENFTFNALVQPRTERLFGGGHHTAGGGFIFVDAKGRYQVTREFVERCLRSSPATGKREG